MSYLASLGVGGQGSMDPQPGYGGQMYSQPVPPPSSGHYGAPLSYSGNQNQNQASQNWQQGQQRQQGLGSMNRNGNGNGETGAWNEMPPPLPASLSGRGNWAS